MYCSKEESDALFEGRCKWQFDNIYTSMYTGGSHQTEFDGETLPSLYNKITENIANGKSLETLAQAIHNIYAKKLSIAPVKVVKMNDLDCSAAFGRLLADSDKSVIGYSDEVFGFCPTVLFCNMIHETKHVQQAYNVHNFVNFGVLPKSDKEKLLLLFVAFNYSGFMFDNELPYYLQPKEIDAFFYELQEISKLNAQYPNKFNGLGYYNEFGTRIFEILYNFEYNKNGMYSKGLKLIYKTLKRGMFSASKGLYGQDMKSLCTQLKLSGFNLEKAFASFIKDLDVMHETVVLLADDVRSLGLKAKFEKNGNLIYHPQKVSYINPLGISSNLNKTFIAMSNDIDDKYFSQK